MVLAIKVILLGICFKLQFVKNNINYFIKIGNKDLKVSTLCYLLGGMAEWLKALVLKTNIPNGITGSNPVTPFFFFL